MICDIEWLTCSSRPRCSASTPNSATPIGASSNARRNASCTSRIASSARLRSVRSRTITEAPTIARRESRIG